MQNELLSYAKAGVATYAGEDWYDRDKCAYCRHSMTQLGSFHVPASNLIEIPSERDKPIYIYSGSDVYTLYENQTIRDGDAFCMHCGSTTARIDKARGWVESERYEDRFYYPKDISPGQNCFFRVAVCPRCGWWYSIENANCGNDNRIEAYAGILQRFDLGSAHTPLQVLQAELPRNLKRIDGIHPKRMEDLLSRILAGVFDCEVRQLGYTRDGGVDLVLLHSDQPVAVQVKRREDHRRTEGVSGIREFLGAALLGDFQRLIYVTNAERYSAAAQEAAKKAVDYGIVEQYELISLGILQDLFPKPDSADLWKEAILGVMRGDYEMQEIPDPYTFKDV